MQINIQTVQNFYWLLLDQTSNWQLSSLKSSAATKQANNRRITHLMLLWCIQVKCLMLFEHDVIIQHCSNPAEPPGSVTDDDDYDDDVITLWRVKLLCWHFSSYSPFTPDPKLWATALLSYSSIIYHPHSTISRHLHKFSDDTAIAGCVSDGNEQ